jgi:hypothetical protein
LVTAPVHHWGSNGIDLYIVCPLNDISYLWENTKEREGGGGRGKVKDVNGNDVRLRKELPPNIPF